MHRSARSTAALSTAALPALLAAWLLAGATGLAVAQTSPAPAASSASMPGTQGNKAARPPVAEEAAKSGVATKKPAKAGAQSGPASAPGMGAAASR